MVGTAAVLERPTLVLNKNWQPVHVATVARSLTLLWNEAAFVVDPDDFQDGHSSTDLRERKKESHTPC